MDAVRLAPIGRTVVGIALAVVAAGCGGSSRGTAPATPSIAAPSAVPSATVTRPAAAPSAGAEQTIHVTYANGKVIGGVRRVKVELGSTVALVVTSDTADEVHLHGYDKHVDVGKGRTARLLFQASIPGVFEAELEKLGRRVVLLQVQ